MMKLVKSFKDDFGNVANITKGKALPYKDAPHKKMLYRLSLYATYNHLVYHVSIYESMEDVLKQLNEFSCGTWKEV